jgi:hypothetical protein
MRSFLAGTEYFRGVSRGGAPHNPEAERGAASLGARRRGSVSATR